MVTQGVDDAYVSEYPPGCRLDPSIKSLIRHYYTQVDTQGKHREYSECWAEAGILIVSDGKEFRGRDAISGVHLGMWNSIPKRTHRPLKVYPFGDDATEVAIIGTVEYWPDDGGYIKKDMAARMKFQRSPKTSKPEIASLQVWLIT
ncbi:hypothetical protein EJ04DRAFT_423933 [Polyplosphaeria fusca]|uniref:Uncharacterized protein n=1 Tax=Polyplosphaeria fusca TaxID=682080 RepID=A0A9P4V932_9PLEO|nr:hypothetical protein EJ04DRAFT_423933 [Polyplosphaeria fusca]